MKIDKDLAVKVDGKVFAGTEIDKIAIDGGKFNMTCIYVNGSKFEVSAHTKDVEFLNTPHIPEFKRSLDKDKTPNTARQYEMYRYGCFYAPPFGSRRDDAEMAIPLDTIRRAVREAMEEREPEPKTATESFHNEEEMRCAEYMSRRFMPCFKDENMEPTAPEEALKKAFNEAMEEMSASMKTAGESINKGLKAMAKFNEPIKVDLSIDGKQLQKMIKTYSKTITRSGG